MVRGMIYDHVAFVLYFKVVAKTRDRANMCMRSLKSSTVFRRIRTMHLRYLSETRLGVHRHQLGIINRLQTDWNPVFRQCLYIVTPIDIHPTLI